jgi:transposase
MRNSQWTLTDREWKTLSPLLLNRAERPKNVKRGRPRTSDDLAAANACLYRYYHSNAPTYRAFGWNQIPRWLGVSPATANRRFREWNQSGAWKRFFDGVLSFRGMRPVTPRRFNSILIPALVELERAYAFLNAHLFQNKLPARVIITITCRSRRLGFFSPSRHSKIHWIVIDHATLRRGMHEILHTLLHEMVHLRNHCAGVPDCHKGYHNRHFRDTARLVGLDCLESSRGYAHTTPNTHAIKVFQKFEPAHTIRLP